MNSAAFWMGAVAAAVIGLLLNEVVDLAAWIAPRIVKSAAARMPTKELRERYREEWLGELNAYDGLKLIKLTKAASLWVGSWRVARVLRSSETLRLPSYVSRLLRSYIWASKSVCLGSLSSSDKLPDLDLVQFAGVLVLGPLGGEVSIVVGNSSASSGGAISFPVTMSCKAEITASVGRLMKLNTIVAVLFYDLFQLRKGVSFGQMLKSHRKARSILLAAARHSESEED